MTEIGRHPWRTPELRDLVDAIRSLQSAVEVEDFLRDLCTPEEPGERALAFPCRNAPVDVLLVRAADIPEYVQDGVVDCGITGQDLVRERGARVEELLQLGFGSCRLDVAVPEESGFARVEDL